MFPASVNTAQPALAARRHRLLALTLAATLVAAGAGAVAVTGIQDRDVRTSPGTWPDEPIQFNDPAVIKGARGGDKSPSVYPYVGDPAVRKGAGGQR